MAHKFIPAAEVPANVGAYFYHLSPVDKTETILVPVETVIQAKRLYSKSTAGVKGWCIVTDHERKYGVTIWL